MAYLFCRSHAGRKERNHWEHVLHGVDHGHKCHHRHGESIIIAGLQHHLQQVKFLLVLTSHLFSHDKTLGFLVCYNVLFSDELHSNPIKMLRNKMLFHIEIKFCEEYSVLYKMFYLSARNSSFGQNCINSFSLSS